MNGSTDSSANTAGDAQSQQLVRSAEELSETLEILYAELLSKHRLGGVLAEGELLSMLMDDAIAILRGHLPTSRVLYLSLAPDGSTLRLEWDYNSIAMTLLHEGYEASLDNDDLKALLGADEPILTGDLLDFLDHHPEAQLARLICTEGFRGALACPLLINEHLHGFLIFASVDPYGIRKSHLKTVRPCLERLARGIQRTRLYDQLVALDPAPATARPRRDRTTPRRPYIHGSPKAKVIYADASNISQLIAEQGLTLAGYHVWTCGSARELVNLFDEFGADVILATPEALQMDGKSLEDVLRQDYPIWLVPFVYVVPSALGNLASDEESGVDTSIVLVKPLRIPSLLSKVEHALQVAREIAAEEATVSDEPIPTASPPEPVPDHVVAGRFHVVEAVSRESANDLYLAEDTMTSGADRVVIKECAVKAGDSQSLSQAAGLMTEASILGALDHPGIVSLLAAGLVDDTAYLALEYIHGISIREQVKENGPIPEQDVVLTALILGLVLEHLEERGFVHRDIRPSHVLLTSAGGIKLIGFSLAAPTRDALTARERQLANALFLPPEWSLNEDEWDIRSDVYALGITLYYAASGTYPFDHNETEEVLRRQREETPEPLHLVNSAIGESCALLIHAMLAKLPDERPSPREVWQEAKRLLQELDPEWECPLE